MCIQIAIREVKSAYSTTIITYIHRLETTVSMHNADSHICTVYNTPYSVYMYLHVYVYTQQQSQILLEGMISPSHYGVLKQTGI